MDLTIGQLRSKLNELTVSVVNGLHGRSIYLQNLNIFEPKLQSRLHNSGLHAFGNGDSNVSWFDSRMKREEATDCEDGRFLFPGVYPFNGAPSKTHPNSTSQIYRVIPNVGLMHVAPPVDIGRRIVDMYKSAVIGLCKPGEQPEEYGRLAKLDVTICQDIHERVTYFGQLVAKIKSEDNPSILKLNAGDLRVALRDSEREKNVVAYAIDCAKRYDSLRVQPIEEMFRALIEMTVDVEVGYVLACAEVRKPVTRSYAFGSGGIVADQKSHAGWR